MEIELQYAKKSAPPQAEEASLSRNNQKHREFFINEFYSSTKNWGKSVCDHSTPPAATEHRDPTQGQLDLVQEMAASGYKKEASSTFRLNLDSRGFRLQYEYDGSGSDANGPRIGPVTNPNDFNALDSEARVYDEKGREVSDPVIRDLVANAVREFREKDEASQQLSRIPLDKKQQTALECIEQALEKKTPDLAMMSSAVQPFAHDPQRFEMVYSAIFLEHLLRGQKVNLSFDGTGIGPLGFEIPSNERLIPGWSNVRLMVPSALYEKMRQYGDE